MVYLGESTGVVIASPDVDYIHLLVLSDETINLKDSSSLGIADSLPFPTAMINQLKKKTAKDMISTKMN